IVVGVLAALGAAAPVFAAEASTVASSRALIDRYCVTCHNTRSKTGGLVLEGLTVDNPSANAETWEKVVRKVQAGLMPPAGNRRPDASEMNTLVSWLASSIDAAATKAPDPGRPVVRRLNRREYHNAIRDLFGLDVDVAELLPADSVGYGFDNIGDVLSSSP